MVFTQMAAYIFPYYETELTEELPDIHATGVLLRHKKSGARIAILPCEDENRVFSITFRTPPLDSTGAAHIVEHTVLCGSERYPLKDPFISLLKGSLNTYLNASTYPDMTMFPVASTNEKDFRNLMDVYLDGVFHPRIGKDRRIFEKEGWSFRLSDPEGPLTVSGVVSNEMKGAFSSPDEIMDREIARALFPDTPYGLESGGDPDEIPKLTYEQFLAFYEKYYHPSNAYIYLYGKLDYEDILSFLDREYLSGFDAKTVDSDIPKQAPFRKARYSTAVYPVIKNGEEEERETRFSFNAAAGSPFDLKRMIAMDVLDYALFSMPGAPVRQALLEKGIGEDAYGSFEDGILQPYFSIVVKGADPAKEELFPEVLFDALRKAKESVGTEALLAGIATMLFGYREADYGSYPKGLIYGIDMLETWLFDDRRPFDTLRRGAVYEELREEVLRGTDYFRDLIEEVFLSNPHAAFLTLRPEEGLLERKEEEQAAANAEILAGLSCQERTDLIRATEDLLAYQETADTPEDAACLPTLALSDIKKETRQLSNEVLPLPEEMAAKGNEAVWHRISGNGIGYFTLYFPLRDLSDETLFYASLLRDILFGVDTGQYPYRELSYAIDTYTGGLSAGMTALRRSYSEPIRVYFTVHGRALYEETDRMFGILSDVLTSSDFSMKMRIREILMKRRLQLSSRIPAAGNYFAAIKAASCLSDGGYFRNVAGGIGFYDRLCALTDRYDGSFEELCGKLRETASDLFSSSDVRISVTCGAEHTERMKKHILEADAKLPTAKKDAAEGLPGQLPAVKNTGIMTGGQVQHVALSSRLSGEESFDGLYYVIRHIFTYGYLWEKIRDQGNAYGCGISFARNGNIVMTSYRDPNLSETLQTFRALPEELAAFDASQEDMRKYIIGTISSLDTPLQPASYGDFCMQAFLSGVSQERLQSERDDVLSADAVSLARKGEALEASLASSAFCVIGSKEMIEKENALFDEVRIL